MTELERACAIVATKDRSPLRVALFERLTAQRPLVRAALAAWERVRGTPAATAMLVGLAAKSWAEVRAPAGAAPVLAAWAYRNEARQVEALAALVPELGIDAVTIDARALVEPGSWSGLAGEGARAAEAWALIDRYARDGDFLVAARVATTVGYGLRMRRVLERHPARAVLVSSDTNPYAVALLAAARELGRKTCFVAHGHVAEGPPPFDFDLGLVDGEVARRAFERVGPVRGRIVLRGAEGRNGSMRTAGLRAGCRTLGVFLSILADWDRLDREIRALRSAFGPDRLVLRLHPNLAMRPEDWRERVDLDGIVVSEGDRVLLDDAAACDLVVAASSSAHLTVLKLGVPALNLAGLDRLEPDFYGFVADGILADAADGLEAGRIADFYDDPGWAERFGRYDAAWPDRQEACDAEVAAALRELVAT